MRKELLENFPFGIFSLNSNGEIKELNSRAQSALSFLSQDLLNAIIKYESAADIPYLPTLNGSIYYLKTFKIAGTSDTLILIGEGPDFWHNVPASFEESIEDFPSDPQAVTEKIAGLICKAVTFERFDLLRVDRHMRKYKYEYSIGIDIQGNPHTAYSPITNSGLGWIFQNEASYLVEHLSPDLFSFREDPLLYQTGFRSILRVPILFDHSIVGAIMLASSEPGHFQIEDALLINQLARLVAQPFFHAGIQLKQEYDALIGAALLQTVIARINKENLNEFLADYCEKLRHTAQMDRVSIFVLDDQQRQRRWIAEAGGKLRQDKHVSYLKKWSPVGLTGVDQMLESKSIVTFNLGDPRFENIDYLIGQGYTSIIYAPIENLDGKIIASLAGATADEQALSPLTAGLFKVASEQLSLILSKLPLQSLTTTQAVKKQSNKSTVPKGFENIISSSNIMRETIHKASLAAKYEFPILITGETGTGKELFAKAIHQSSSVATGPYIVVNSAAIPANLLESELFGYQEGAFTGGLKGGKRGKIQLADGGTLFLDELGELSPDLQAKILRVIQEKEVEPLGATKPIPVNVRIISATNRDLNHMVQKGEFREDLLYRVNTIEIHLPPLRERHEDILELAEHLLKFLSNTHGVPLKMLAPEAKKLLLSYSWPGNVRQLQNVINRLFVFVEGQTIQAKDLPPDIRSSCTPSNETEQERIARLLKEFNGNKTALAHFLGITRTGLWKKLKRLGLE